MPGLLLAIGVVAMLSQTFRAEAIPGVFVAGAIVALLGLGLIVDWLERPQ